ncbi:MAG: hypothetical protein UY56_C0024G0014 [Parcubacteria group bacterium GW2011_GWA1_50_14]|nr:MAG: hypothetical protein UY56_C0024G0014 [Parcubacteria group bacterium GW2011_GWA1_50_14]
MDYLFLLIAGFGGGVVRGLVGFVKYQYSYKQVGFNMPYFFGMMFISGVVGLLVSAALRDIAGAVLTVVYSPSIAFIAGYAGGDFLENLYKILFRKTTLFE